MLLASRHPRVAAAAVLLLAGLLFPAAPSRAQDKLGVVASFSILGDMVAQIGGDRVAVTTLVGPNQDSHVFEPTPQDARTLARADLVVVNGLALEGWIERLVDASGYLGPEVVATAGVATIPFDHAQEVEHEEGAGHDEEAGHDGHAPGDASETHGHGASDPHAWQSLANAVTYARNIAAGLEKADPQDAAYYRERLATYEAALSDLDADLKRAFAAVPADRRKVITSHEAFGYFAAAYGVEFQAPEGVSTDSQASASDVARIIRQIRDEGIRAIFVETMANAALIEQIAAETGIAVGGHLYSDALSETDGPAPTYLDMVRYNSRQILDALTAR